MRQINYNVERTSLYESVANNLEEMIVNDSSQIGQKLPSEQMLATNFGVSRNVIREAMKILKERQLITVRVGEGAYINKPSDQSVTDMLNRIVLMDNIDPIKIYELRTILEVASCRMAVQNVKSPAEFDCLDEINENMRKNKENIDKRIKLDIEFHKTVAHLSSNPLVELFEQSICNMVYPVMRTALLPERGNEDGINDHQKLVTLLRARDVESAATLMTEHLLKSAQNYLDGFLIQKR